MPKHSKYGCRSSRRSYGGLRYGGIPLPGGGEVSQEDLDAFIASIPTAPQAPTPTSWYSNMRDYISPHFERASQYVSDAAKNAYSYVSPAFEFVGRHPVAVGVLGAAAIGGLGYAAYRRRQKRLAAEREKNAIIEQMRRSRPPPRRLSRKEQLERAMIGMY